MEPLVVAGAPDPLRPTTGYSAHANKDNNHDLYMMKAIHHLQLSNMLASLTWQL
jgi:hypothetical protein